MSTGIIYALCAPALWAVCNHIDTYLLKRLQYTTAGTLTIFGGLTGLIIAAVIFIFHPNVSNGSLLGNAILIGNGMLLIASYLPYYYALQEDDTSIVIAIYQTIPIFAYILGAIFLHEHLSSIQIIGGIIIVCGSLFISLDLTESTIRLKQRVLVLMLLASLMIAVNYFIFKVIALQSNFWTSAFWENAGACVLGLLLYISVRSYRQDFHRMLTLNRFPVLSWSFATDFINIIAKLFANFASLSIPLALVFLLNAFQPFFVLIYGLILGLLSTKIRHENTSRQAMVQKIAGILIIFIGSYFLIYFGS